MLAFIALAVLLRLASLVLSRRNEARMKAAGAVELGAGNSRILALAHILFYLAAIAEGLTWREPRLLSAPGLAGLALYAFGMLALLAVIRGLGRFWTVKLILARDHALVTTPLFRHLRHPNYWLGLMPELIGFALVMQAWIVLAIGLPLYLIPLLIRVRQEEAAMRDRFGGDYAPG